MRVRRPKTSAFLLLCGLVLIVSIYAGEKMGARVLQRTTQTAAVIPDAVTPTPAPSAVQQGPIVDWHRLQVVAVPTDPGFPDPRVTKPPTPSPKPSPKPTPPPTPGPFSFPTPTPPGSAPAGASSPPSSPPPPGTSTLPPYAYPTPPPGFSGGAGG